MRRVAIMIVLLAFSAAEALLTPPVQRLSAGAVTPRIAAASTMQLDVIPLCDSTSPGLLGVDRSSTVSAGSDPCMSGVCGLSVLETHRISRATRTANVMSLFVFCESRGGRRTTLSPIIYLWSQPSASPVDLSVGRRPSALLAAELPLSRPPLSLHARGPPRRAADPRRPPQAKGTVRTRPLPSSSPAPSPPVTPTFASSLFPGSPYLHLNIIAVVHYIARINK